jgi:hypothetical protein
MKKEVTGAFILLLAFSSASAQKQGDPLPYNKERLDSIFQHAPKLGQPFVLPGNPNPLLSPVAPQKFEELYPGATVINKNSRGTVYNMPTDNMAVLVPNMQGVENMPTGKNQTRPNAVVPRNMPNPYYTPKKNKR